MTRQQGGEKDVEYITEANMRFRAMCRASEVEEPTGRRRDRGACLVGRLIIGKENLTKLYIPDSPPHRKTILVVATSPKVMLKGAFE